MAYPGGGGVFLKLGSGNRHLLNNLETTFKKTQTSPLCNSEKGGKASRPSSGKNGGLCRTGL